MLVFLSNVTIPLLIFLIIGYGLLNQQNIYTEFTQGAKEGVQTVVKIMPTLVGLMVAVGILRASGFLEAVAAVLGTVTEYIGFPSELVPLTLVKMFSSSAATGLLLDIYKSYGCDSLLGNTASLIMSSTETIFYTMSIYYMAADVKKTRWTLPGALTASLAGVSASVFLASWL